MAFAKAYRSDAALAGAGISGAAKLLSHLQGVIGVLNGMWDGVRYLIGILRRWKAHF